MKLCVYTCITGNYDSVKEIDSLNIKEKIDFICYTNNKNMKSKTWKVVYVEDDKLTNVQLARKVKILGTEELKKYDMTLWMDGDIQWNTSILKFIDKFVDLETYDLVGFKHFERNKIADELLTCFELEKINAKEATKIYDYYKETDFKDDMGLIESTLLFRNFNNKNLQKAMKKWFDFIINLTHRDQLSFNYVEYLTGLKVNLLDIKIWDNEYFKSYKHSKLINGYIYYKKGESFDLDFEELNNISDSNKIVIKPKYNTDTIRIKFDSKYGLIVKNLKCKSAKYINTNCVDIDGNEYCCNCPLIIELIGSFKGNELVDLAFDLEIKDVFELIGERAEIKKEIGKLKEEQEKEIQRYEEIIKQCREELDVIMNSKSMKITKPLRDVTALLSRAKRK